MVSDVSLLVIAGWEIGYEEYVVTLQAILGKALE